MSETSFRLYMTTFVYTSDMTFKKHFGKSFIDKPAIFSNQSPHREHCQCEHLQSIHSSTLVPHWHPHWSTLIPHCSTLVGTQSQSFHPHLFSYPLPPQSPLSLPWKWQRKSYKKKPEMRLFYLITAIIARPMLTMLTAWLQDQMFIPEKEFHIWWFWVILLWSGNGKPWNTVVAIAEDLYSQTLSLLNI